MAPTSGANTRTRTAPVSRFIECLANGAIVVNPTKSSADHVHFELLVPLRLRANREPVAQIIREINRVPISPEYENDSSLNYALLHPRYGHRAARNKTVRLRTNQTQQLSMKTLTLTTRLKRRTTLHRNLQSLTKHIPIDKLITKSTIMNIQTKKLITTRRRKF
jgi:hypothetical protein